MFDPTLHPHLAKALAAHDAQYDYDEHGAPATEQFHDYCDRVRSEEREQLDAANTRIAKLERQRAADREVVAAAENAAADVAAAKGRADVAERGRVRGRVRMYRMSNRRLLCERCETPIDGEPGNYCQCGDDEEGEA